MFYISLLVYYSYFNVCLVVWSAGIGITRLVAWIFDLLRSYSKPRFSNG
jgi:hypothetical protein